EKKAAGTLKRPNPAELFRPALRKTTLITTLLVACSYGAAFGALLHLPRIVPGLPQVLHLTRQQQAPDEAAAGADGQRRQLLSKHGRPGGTPCFGVAREPHREPAATTACLPHTGPDHFPAPLPLPCPARPRTAEVRHLPRDGGHDGAVQL